MKTLVLCVDRDNDIGVKADIKTPIIGREENLEAAMKLGLADPEDADVNTLLTSISMYDELVKNGMNAEIATICGDPNVGYESDRILTKQLDDVLDEVKPDHAYLVSDGAEDEYIFPIIASRVKVNHVKRVYVKQSPGVESFVYMAGKAIRDERWRRRVVAPVALMLLALAVVLVWNEALALPTLLLVLGLYLLFRAYQDVLHPSRIAARISNSYSSIKESITSGKISVFFDFVAVVVAIVAIYLGIDAAHPFSGSLLHDFFFFLGGSLWWFIAAFLTRESGRVAEAYFTKGKIPKGFWYGMLAFLAFGLVLSAGIQSISTILGITDPSSTLTLIYSEIGLGISIVLVAALIYRASEREATSQDAWRP